MPVFEGKKSHRPEEEEKKPLWRIKASLVFCLIRMIRGKNEKKGLRWVSALLYQACVCGKSLLGSWEKKITIVAVCCVSRLAIIDFFFFCILSHFQVRQRILEGKERSTRTSIFRHTQKTTSVASLCTSVVGRTRQSD